MNLYDVLRKLCCLFTAKRVNDELAKVRADEAAAKKRVLDAAARLLDKREEN